MRHIGHDLDASIANGSQPSHRFGEREFQVGVRAEGQTPADVRRHGTVRHASAPCCWSSSLWILAAELRRIKHRTPHARAKKKFTIVAQVSLNATFRFRTGSRGDNCPEGCRTDSQGQRRWRVIPQLLRQSPCLGATSPPTPCAPGVASGKPFTLGTNSSPRRTLGGGRRAFFISAGLITRLDGSVSDPCAVRLRENEAAALADACIRIMMTSWHRSACLPFSGLCKPWWCCAF